MGSISMAENCIGVTLWLGLYVASNSYPFLWIRFSSFLTWKKARVRKLPEPAAGSRKVRFVKSEWMVANSRVVLALVIFWVNGSMKSGFRTFRMFESIV